MEVNLNEYMTAAVGANESLANAGTCALETAQTISQCNDYLMKVFVIGLMLGCIITAVGMALGVWYRGRK